MKILYICHRLPYPPTRGGKIRAFHTIRHLARTHQVTVASLAHSAAELAEGARLADYCAASLVECTGAVARWLRAGARLPTRTPSTMGFFHSPRLARRLGAALAATTYDLVIAYSSSMAPYAMAGTRSARILDFGDVDSEKWLEYARFKPPPLAWGYRLEGLKLRRAEARLAATFDVSTCTTRSEAQTLARAARSERCDWFPNGVDGDYFQPAAAACDADAVCFVGHMDYFPNQQAVIDFCRSVLPLLRAARPATRFNIVGADPPRRVRDLGSLPGVIVTGQVPDIRPHLGAAALSVAPLRIARGTQNKILESMAMGVPVVCSTLAAAGVDALPGEHLLTADRPRDCADAILHLLGDRAARQRLGQAARARVLSHHSWAAAMRKLDAIIDEVLARRAATGR